MRHVPFGRSRNNHVFCAGLYMLLSAFLRSKRTCALDSNVHSKLPPWKILRLFLGQAQNFLAVYHQILLACPVIAVRRFYGAIFFRWFYRLPISAVYSVILEKIRKRLLVCQIINCDYFDSLRSKCLSEKCPADTAKTVDCYLHET